MHKPGMIQTEGPPVQASLKRGRTAHAQWIVPIYSFTKGIITMSSSCWYNNSAYTCQHIPHHIEGLGMNQQKAVINSTGSSLTVLLAGLLSSRNNCSEIQRNSDARGEMG